jgi:2-polyprenyl-6-methoxyphenol hydroxylase-like FAD-dependent oxidoreductase
MHVLICGGGVIGASIAYFLSCRGVKATVIGRHWPRLRRLGEVGRVSGARLVRRLAAGAVGAAQLCDIDRYDFAVRVNFEDGRPVARIETPAAWMPKSPT